VKINLLKLRSIGAAFLGCALLSTAALVAQDDHRDHDGDHRYYDGHHKDYHGWNDHEDRAYRLWWEQRHRPYIGFDRLNERQRQRYWDWRHEHSDTVLRIDIR
jgi:hypothetical protein